MTDKIVEVRRAEFEAWLHGEFGPNYRSILTFTEVSSMGMAYNAALDSLCIELPEREELEEGECGSSFDIACAHNNAINACREAIHAAGVKTR